MSAEVVSPYEASALAILAQEAAVGRQFAQCSEVTQELSGVSLEIAQALFGAEPASVLVRNCANDLRAWVAQLS